MHKHQRLKNTSRVESWLCWRRLFPMKMWTWLLSDSRLQLAWLANTHVWPTPSYWVSQIPPVSTFLKWYINPLQCKVSSIDVARQCWHSSLHRTCFSMRHQLCFQDCCHKLLNFCSPKPKAIATNLPGHQPVWHVENTQAFTAEGPALSRHGNCTVIWVHKAGVHSPQPMLLAEVSLFGPLSPPALCLPIPRSPTTIPHGLETGPRVEQGLPGGHGPALHKRMLTCGSSAHFSLQMATRSSVLLYAFPEHTKWEITVWE